ncbi:MAG: aminoacyl-tRNA hydrolase [Lentisphaerae bacterium]|nr:aminoacyl-tRNA hydrolase [Lentisphaerota bacterium]MBT4818092.1 aminoacyl-tRNA hydrolase [Lentisphaerota bacterium]MBT5611915.1 aminoacyl-tRNA hydrolase [Lentisphaerota bacterium]MBT7055488.1 aminoacyl-tRNA hydrolase [Lentisphaerota bacterium]MBT7847532.1 aminoacyl-tRNA hydrolase [Lentisphaerota bacterium]
MIRLAPNIEVREDELAFSFVRASGPGGQHVNTTSTAVQLRFDVLHSPALPESVRQRLLRLGGARVTDAGEIIIDARRYRSQARNREDALERLRGLVLHACQRPKPRRKTRPTRASKERRLSSKKQRGETKSLRRKPRDD